MKKLVLAIALFGVALLNSQTTVYADAKYGFDANDATINFYEAIEKEKGTGNTLIFRDMGTPWVVSPCYKMFNVSNLTIVFEEGFVLQESTLMAEKDNRRRYIPYGSTSALNSLKNNYPNGTAGTHYELNQKSKVFWVQNSNNLTIEAYGAEFIGVFPTLNIGNDPNTRVNETDNSWEFNHWLQIEIVGNFKWSGGYIHNWSGDGFNLKKLNNDCIIEDAKIYFNKRLGTQSHSTNGTLTVRDCDISYNGRGQNNSTDFGTNTGHGSTWEPNVPGESIQGVMTNCRFVENRDSGVGLHVAKVDDTAIKDINFTLSDCHLENNGTQVDYTRAGAFTLSGTDSFTNPLAQRGQQPLGGTASFANTAVWGDTYGFLNTGHYKGNYNVSFDETVVYKVSTTNAQKNFGEGIVEWIPVATLPSGTKLADFDFGNITVIHEHDEFFIDLNNANNITEIESTVTGNLTIAMNSAKPIWSIKNSLTNNSTLTENRYTLNTLPINTISVQATIGNAIKSSNTNGEFTFTRTGSTDFPMAVAYNVVTSGVNAEMLNDFKLLRGSVVIPTGQTSVTVPVIPLNPNRTGGSRNITLTIQPKTDLYTVGSNNSATVNLLDNGNSTAQTTTLDPIHDAYLEGSNRFNNNFLKVEQGNRVSYLKFDLSSVTGNITSAEFRFRVDGDAGTGTAEIYKGTATNWTEADLTTSNAPSEDGLLGSTTDIGQMTTTVTVPLSASILSGGGDLSLVVKHVGSSDFWMASDESANAPGPQLSVTFEPSTNIAVTGVTVAPSTLDMETGDTETLTAAVTPSNATDQGVTWSSSDTAIATVDANGLVTAVAVGSTTITVTTDDGSFTASANVTVTSSAPIVSNITVSDIMEDSFKVSWNLNEGSKGRIEYGTSSGNYTEQTTSAENFLTYHLQRVGNNNAPPLQPGTTYYWRIRTEDIDGNVGYSDEQTTTTASPQPQTATLEPIHDAYLQGPGSTRYNNNLLRVEDGNRTSYMKYDLGTVNGTITGAELHFRIAGGDTGVGTAEVYHGSDTNWTETTLDANNAPSQVTLWGTTTDIGQGSTDVIVPLSVGSLPGGGNLSLIVEHVGNDDFAMASKEHSTKPAPRLVVTYIPNSGSSLKARVDFDSTDTVSEIASLSPNPTTNEVRIYGIEGEKEITLIDFSGKLLIETTSQEVEPVIDLSGYAPGIYYMKVTTSITSKTFKVVKQ